MIDEKTVALILAGEFSGEFATDEEKAARAAHIVRRIGTTEATANVHRMMEECENTPAVWTYGDNRYTVVDIRPKNPAAVALGAIGGSRTSTAKRAVVRANASKPPKPGSKRRGRPRKPQE